MITIELKDGSKLSFEEPITLFEVAKKISRSLAKEALVAKVDGNVTDLRNLIKDGTKIEFCTKNDPEGLAA